MKDRLLACPFCGSKAKITLRSDGGIQVNCLNAVECWSAIGPLYPWDKTKREAKRIVTKVTGKWNRRKGVSQTSTNKEQYGKDRELAVKNITSKLKPVANGTDRDVQVHELLIKLSNAAARCAFDAGFAYASALAKAAANPPP